MSAHRLWAGVLLIVAATWMHVELGQDGLIATLYISGTILMLAS